MINLAMNSGKVVGHHNERAAGHRSKISHHRFDFTRCVDFSLDRSDMEFLRRFHNVGM